MVCISHSAKRLTSKDCELSIKRERKRDNNKQQQPGGISSRALLTALWLGNPKIMLNFEDPHTPS